MDFRFLTAKEICGNNALKSMNDYGTAAHVTDLAIILGAMSSTTYELDHDWACYYWIATRTYSYGGYLDNAMMAGSRGKCYSADRFYRCNGARPALSLKETSKISPNNIKTCKSNYLAIPVNTCEFGEYPQTLADDDIAKQLEILYQNKNLKQTSKKYTFDTAKISGYAHVDNYKPFNPTEHPEYELNGDKYVRVKGRHDLNYLRNYTKVQAGKSYWLKVEPIEWIMDPSGVWYAKKCLFSGIQFNEPITEYTRDDDFSKTFIKSYLDNYFAKEIMPENTNIKTHEQVIDNSQQIREQDNSQQLKEEQLKEQQLNKHKKRLEQISGNDIKAVIEALTFANNFNKEELYKSLNLSEDALTSQEELQEKEENFKKFKQFSIDELKSPENKEFIEEVAENNGLVEIFEGLKYEKQAVLLKVLRTEIVEDKEASAKIHQIMKQIHAQEKELTNRQKQAILESKIRE